MYDDVSFTMELKTMAACHSVMFVELCESGIGIRVARLALFKPNFRKLASFQAGWRINFS